MKKTTFKRVISLLLTFTLLLSAFAVFSVSAAESEEASVEIVSKNVYYGEQVKAAGTKFWAANWGPDDGYPHTDYKPNIGEVCWQYTSKGSVNGIVWVVDMDLLYEDVPTPDPGPTPTPTGSEKMVIIITDVINRRSAPVMDASNIVGSYTYGQHVQTKGITDDKQWYIDLANKRLHDFGL